MKKAECAYNIHITYRRRIFIGKCLVKLTFISLIEGIYFTGKCLAMFISPQRDLTSNTF